MFLIAALGLSLLKEKTVEAQPRNLVVTATVRHVELCSVDPSIFAARVALQLTYSNRGTEGVILFSPKANVLSAVSVAATREDLRRGVLESKVAPDAFERVRRIGRLPAKPTAEFVVLPGGGDFKVTGSFDLFWSRDSRRSGVVSPGHHFASAVVGYWPFRPGDTERMAIRWRSYGTLLESSVVEPFELEIDARRDDIRDCKAGF